MELVDRVRNNLYDTFADFDTKKGLRLVILIGGYILIRNLASRELAKRKLKNEVRKDERDLSDKNIKELVDDPDAEGASSATPFGWGNMTRQRVKKQEELFTKVVERAQLQQEQGDDDFADIEEFLED